MTSTKKAKELIFEIDNSKEVQQFQLQDGFILWLHIRYTVYTYLEQYFNLNDKSDSPKIEIPRKPFFSRLSGYYKTLISKNPFLISTKKFDSIVFSTSLGVINYDNSVNTRSRVNYCFQELPKTLNLYFSNKEDFSKKFDPPYAFADSFAHMSVFLTKIFPEKLNNEDIVRINDLIKFLKINFQKYLTNDQFNNLENELIFFLKQYKKLNCLYMYFFKRTDLKYVVVENANYGGAYISQLIFVANSLNIKTIEIQHGILDCAYQYGNELVILPNYFKHKTSYLLTFGTYWNSQIKSSTIGYDIGNIVLDNLIMNLELKYSNTILFISQGVITNDLILIAMNMSEKIAEDFKIYFCLHPNEESSKLIYLEKFAASNIQVVSSKYLYGLMAECKFVVGSYSAALFDALYFKKRIFVQKNNFSDEFIPTHIGTRFSNSEELLSLIVSDNNIEDHVFGEDIWTYNCKNRFINFLENVIKV
jgi:hypothetical protein